MSKHARSSRVSTPDIRARKGGRPLVCLTAYSASVATLLDEHTDLLLVGDSLGMVLYGLDSTLGVTLEMMIAHGAAVVRGTRHACIVVDLPFGTYQESPEQAFRSAARVMTETGASAVKLEGGEPMAPTIRFLTQRGIPVCGHVGLMPQAMHTAGGFRATGRTETEADRIVADAKAAAEAGAFAVVIEGTMTQVAQRATEAISVPTIGIGASAVCDGQILVTDDMLGLFGGFKPRFVRRYADLAAIIAQATAEYARDVSDRSFPGPEHSFGMKATGSA